MLQVKLPYYPKVVAMATETRFGVMEIDVPEIYNTPLTGRIIVKVDKLRCLIKVLGHECFTYREYFYNILAGKYDDNELNRRFAIMYRRYPHVTEYVTNKYYYGDSSIPLVDRCLKPLREMVDSYGIQMYELLKDMGGKYLIQTHDYIYFSFNNDNKIKDLEGVELIC